MFYLARMSHTVFGNKRLCEDREKWNTTFHTHCSEIRGYVKIGKNGIQHFTHIVRK